VVQNDLHDTGIRQILNFGHTLGDAIETITNFELSHGEAIAIGMRKRPISASKKGSFASTT
jgi:3-dehydroquinate synthetase